ncbi:MAG: hypothetical protein Ct9H300mP25_13070 [Acidobacteriota bacterium]|nr:MAG: hypothetical protein Ct9H300mP25_13070 [Acidobacteriota bacterium]
MRDRLGSGVVVLAADTDGKAALVVTVTRDLTDRVHAGQLVKALAPTVGGRGGGRPDFAQAGGGKSNARRNCPAKPNRGRTHTKQLMAPDRKSITNKPDDSVAVRLDVWLDVACLFRTRSEAQRAIKGGKVALNDHRGKPHREIHAGDRVCITRTNGVKQSLKYSALRIDMSQSMTHEHFTLIGHHHHPKKKLLFGSNPTCWSQQPSKMGKP